MTGLGTKCHKKVCSHMLPERLAVLEAATSRSLAQMPADLHAVHLGAGVSQQQARILQSAEVLRSDILFLHTQEQQKREARAAAPAPQRQKPGGQDGNGPAGNAGVVSPLQPRPQLRLGQDADGAIGSADDDDELRDVRQRLRHKAPAVAAASPQQLQSPTGQQAEGGGGVDELQAARLRPQPAASPAPSPPASLGKRIGGSGQASPKARLPADGKLPVNGAKTNRSARAWLTGLAGIGSGTGSGSNPGSSSR